MDRSAFAGLLRNAVVEALAEFRRAVTDESPYAFAIILGQCGQYLGYAVATEEGLRRVAAEYDLKGYRYRGSEWENFDNQERVAAWLRWSNPDDGWHYGDFAEALGIADGLTNLVRGGAFGEDAERLEEFCTEVLAALRSDPAWSAISLTPRVITGVTSGEDPRDFLRTATRTNDFETVRQLWAEHWLCEELSSRIQLSRSDPA